MTIFTIATFGGRISIRFEFSSSFKSNSDAPYTCTVIGIKVHSGYQEISTQPFCDLCEKLNSNLPKKIYRDIDAWWYNSILTLF